jgi:hypothetical protein
MKAIQALERQKDNLHYSSAVSLSKQDIMKIHSHLVDSIQQVKATVRDSKEEELYCFALDFFRIE